VGDHLVLDVDVRHGGPERLAKLLSHFGPLPPTWQVRTPTGGSHFWFRAVEFQTRSLAQGVEVLRGNRLVTLPPSNRSSGVYRWVQHPFDTPLAEAPRWLRDSIRVPELPPAAVHRREDGALREKRARAYLVHIGPAVAGNYGHARTFWAAQLFVRGFELEPERALAVLTDWNAGCAPPWSERELQRKLREAAQRGRMPWGAMLRGEP
jgi:hypothetical protein